MRKIIRILLLAGCSLLAAHAAQAGDGKTYTNPVRTVDGQPLHIADPFVYTCKGVYYLTGTTNLPEGKGFAYYTSADLLTWKYGGVLYRRPEGHIGYDAFWAPEVKQYQGKFYLTYSCATKHGLLTCLAVSDKPEGPFTDLHAPWFDLGYSVIDADIFVDDDGTPYLYFSRNGGVPGISLGLIYGARLKKDLSGLASAPVFIMSASQDWEKVKWGENRCNEGPFVFKHGGTYYMTYSANDTGYEHYGVGVATATRPLGLWEKYEDNPMMTTDLSRGISSPGHNSITTAPDGELYMVYHRHADAHCTKPNWDRVVCIDRLYFTPEGKLKTTGPTSTPQPVGW